MAINPTDTQRPRNLIFFIWKRIKEKWNWLSRWVSSVYSEPEKRRNNNLIIKKTKKEDA
jgi:isopentenyldiphosphate isomerase